MRNTATQLENADVRHDQVENLRGAQQSENTAPSSEGYGL